MGGMEVMGIFSKLKDIVKGTGKDVGKAAVAVGSKTKEVGKDVGHGAKEVTQDITHSVGLGKINDKPGLDK